MVLIIIGALGTVSNDIEKWLAEIGVTCRLESLLRACLLGTARPKVTGGDLMFKEDTSKRAIRKLCIMRIITVIIKKKINNKQ